MQIEKLLCPQCGYWQFEDDATECEVLFQFAESLLMSATSSHEVPDRRLGVLLVCDDDRVFVKPIVGLEELQLEVLGRLPRDLLSEDHDSLGALPSLQSKSERKAIHARMDLRPAPSTTDAITHIKPFPHRELHGEIYARSG